MSELLPPSPQRIRDARAQGLRPRSGLLVLAGLALTMWALLELEPVPIAASSLSRWLALGFAEPLGRVEAIAFGSSDRASLCVAGLLGLLALLGASMIVGFGRAPARRKLQIAPGAESVPAGFAVLFCVAALGLGVVAGLPVLASAARSVDAGPQALTVVWIAWARRGLLALALICAGVGVIERLVSDWSLWRALHSTRAQAREDARAAGRR